MEPNIELIKKEWSLSEEDIIRIPSFFNKSGQSIVPNMVKASSISSLISE